MVIFMSKNVDYTEWETIVNPIINSPEFLKRKTFRHHGDVTVYEHSIKVSKLSYKLAKRLHTDYKSAAIAGILHDFYTTPWQEDTERKPLFKKHGFTHAKIALTNAREFYPKYLNPKIENAILRHMFPLNPIPPRYLIGYIVTISDKVKSMDMFNRESISKILGKKVKKG